jgi:eukaryotic-like serine/threonine-protein kinase
MCAEMAISPGQVIGDYEVIGLIGAGGMGHVYKVRNIISERIDAMKVLRPQAENTPDAAGRFLREIKLQASLRHPNIAVLHTAMRFGEEILMFMEMLDGIGLDQRLRHGSIPPAEAVQYTAQCLRALEYAHERGVVHRDIKPSNLILTPNGVVKLLDFGIARGNQDLSFTGTGTAVGSAHYMSPEQALGGDIDGRADLYSTGIMLYEMLIGARPFAGENAYSILKAHIEREPLSPADLNPSLPRGLCDAVLRALRKDREARFPTAAAFRAAIEEKTPTGARASQAPASQAPMEPARAAGIDSPTAARIAVLLAAELGPIAAHLVKQACTRTTDIREVCRLAAGQVGDETGRRRFLESCAKELHLALPAAPVKPVTGTREPVPGTKSAAWDPQVLDRVKKALAEFVGPVAKVIVDKAVGKCSNVDELYELLATEIDAPGDRAKFLASKPGHRKT